MSKKIIGVCLSVAVVLAILIDGYIMFFKKDSQTTASSTDKQESKVSSNTNTSSSSSSKKASSSSSSSSSNSGQYKDGTYTGKATSTEWGDVQLQITVKGGKLTSINVLESPDSEQKSVNINQQALPTYKSEAISAQSSSIQQISGATETYKGFTGSLQDALNQASNSSTSAENA